MTSLTFALSRAIAQTWNEGDEIILSHCDHDANVTPWALAARDRGVTVRWMDIDPANVCSEPGDIEEFTQQPNEIGSRCMASNAVGTVHPVAKLQNWHMLQVLWYFSTQSIMRRTY